MSELDFAESLDLLRQICRSKGSRRVHARAHLDLAARAPREENGMDRICNFTVAAISLISWFSRPAKPPTAPLESHPYTPLHVLKAGPWEGLYVERRPWRPYLPDMPSDLS
ncbi:hypothetical protein GCM10023346_31540 [Arthrobacter gyeryongensis]|uniref:Uncharacterized protein n=1 Tax=Arthrobacter gyeryongensis TaxID=1650592 RepID=A0ABP9SLB0_9MICC